MVALSSSVICDLISPLFFFEQADNKKDDNNKIKKILYIFDKKAFYQNI